VALDHPANELGLWQATDGTLKALINVGPANPKEFSEVTSTTEMLKPLAQATGGDARRVVDGSGKHRSAAHRAGALLEHLPRRRLDGREDARRQRGARRRRAADVRRPDRLLLLLGAFAATWLREGPNYNYSYPPIALVLTLPVRRAAVSAGARPLAHRRVVRLLSRAAARDAECASARARRASGVRQHLLRTERRVDRGVPRRRSVSAWSGGR
jgi:hypothetical protein